MFFKKVKKKTVFEQMQESKVNISGEILDHLDKDGNLPFGWVAHRRKYVDMIEQDVQPFRDAIHDAKTDIEKYGALKSFLLFVQDGKAHYLQMGECVEKYFEDYIFEEAKKRKKDFVDLERKLKRQQ